MRHDGRANPHQLVLSEATVGAIARLRQDLVAAHVDRFGSDRGLLVGLQLTHSGRFARPNARERTEPLVAYRHPLLDRRFPAGVRVVADDELDRLVADFVRAGRRALDAGFRFVDVKHCRGLGHGSSPRGTQGHYGGSGLPRFLREVVSDLQAEAKGLAIGVRFSAFDTVPWRKGPDGAGEPESAPGYRSAFGLFEGDLDAALDDARELLRLLESLDVRWVCLTAGSPYYNPHVQRPALFPPSDGYTPPEDPLRGVARQIDAGAVLKAEFPRLVFVGSAYSYLQEWLPNVGQRVLREEKADFIGLGRMVLSYPDLPADVLEGRPLRRKSLCRTFSDCTTRLPAAVSSPAAIPSTPSTPRARRPRSSGASRKPCAREQRGIHSRASEGPHMGRSHGVPGPLLHRRVRHLRPAVLLRLPRPGSGVDAPGGHVGQCVQQDPRGPGVRLRRRRDHRPLRPAAADAGRDPDGRPRARGPGRGSWPGVLLLLLRAERARLRLRRSPAEPGDALGLVRRRARPGDGHRLPRHRHRRRPRAPGRLRAHAALRLARGACWESR